MSEQAKHAIIAAKNRKRWGRWTTSRYCINRGVKLSLYRLARQLEAASNASR